MVPMSSLALYVRVAIGLAIAAVATPAYATVDPAAVFAKKCSSCHTYGKGPKVGPDLKGVTDRRSRNWLTTWIRSSERMIKSGDATGIALFKKFKQERMPDQEFSPADIGVLLDYLAASGPDATDRSRPRNVSTATPTDVTRGRKLFLGTISPRSGGASCASCHMVQEDRTVPQATFGGDLTHVYSRVQDTALSTILDRSCFPRLFNGKRAALAEDESFAVRAFLRYVDKAAPPSAVRVAQ